MRFDTGVAGRTLFLIAILVSIALGDLFGFSFSGNWRFVGPSSNGSQELFSKTGTIKSDDVVESSGLAFSQRNSAIFWTMNDSGNGTEIFAINLDGTSVAKVSVGNSQNVDWEAMSSFVLDSVPYLVVADVGDNSVRRESCQLYVFPEPDLDKDPKMQSVDARRIEFIYEDGARNCEAIAVEPRSREIWLVEKVYYDSRQEKPPGVYVLGWPEKNEGIQKVKRVADFSARNVTGMAFSPDGNRLIIRTYTNAYLYSRTADAGWRDILVKQQPVLVPLPLQRQGESICFTPDSSSLIATSEYRRQAIWKIDLNRFLKLLAEETESATDPGTSRDKLRASLPAITGASAVQ